MHILHISRDVVDVGEGGKLWVKKDAARVRTCLVYDRSLDMITWIEAVNCIFQGCKSL